MKFLGGIKRDVSNCVPLFRAANGCSARRPVAVPG